jgi:hypothetical protein
LSIGDWIAPNLAPFNSGHRANTESDSYDDELSETSTTMARLWINHDMHRRCLLISYSNLNQNSPNMFHISLPLHPVLQSLLCSDDDEAVHGYLHVNSHNNQVFACEISYEIGWGGGEESQLLLMFYSWCALRGSFGSRVDLHILFALYDLRNISTCAVRAVDCGWAQTIRKCRRIEELQTHVDQKTPLVCTRWTFSVTILPFIDDKSLR